MTLPTPRPPPQVSPEFSYQAIVYLIEAVGRRWSLYGTRERSQLFQSVQKELEEQGHCLPVEKIRRKWNNLIVTYKRVKYRGRETGQARTSWEYFEVLVCFIIIDLCCLARKPMLVALLGKTDRVDLES